MTADHTHRECPIGTFVPELPDRPPILGGWLAARRLFGSDRV